MCIGWVPLHEAASRGHIEVVQALLSLNAPVRPRTNNNDTPATIAARNGHFQCATLLGMFCSLTKIILSGC